MSNDTKVKESEVKLEEVSKEIIKEDSKPTYSQEELLVIFDDILFSGEYREDITIRNKLKVTFKSRTAAETTAITKELDSKSFNLISTLQQEQSLLTLVYSLVSYAGKDLSGLDPIKKREFVTGLASVVVASLSDALIKFDQKIDMAFSEGEQNF